MTRASLPLARVNSPLFSYGCTPYSASGIAFGLGYISLPSYGCALYGASTIAFGLARVLIPLAWITSSLPSCGCTLYGASIIAFGLGSFFFLSRWLYAVWCEYHCLRPGLPHLCHRMPVRRMACVSLHLAWVHSSLLSYGCTPYGASMIACSLCYHIFDIVWL